MKKTGYIFLLSAILLLLITSCDKTDKIINRDTVEEDVKMVKEAIKGKDKDSIISNVLDYFIAYSKDLNYYKEYLKKKYNNYESKEKYLVSKAVFKENADKLFNELKENKYTYKQLLKEMDVLTRLWDENYNELVPLYKKVDSICSRYQKFVDSTETDSERVKDSLKRMIDLKVIKIEKTYHDFKKAIEMEIQLTNRTGQQIEGLSFTIELTDKLGKKVVTVDGFTNNGFTTFSNQFWYFEKDKQEDIYNALEYVKANQVTSKYYLKKININGTIIGAGLESRKVGDYFLYSQNSHYVTPAKLLNGKCDYLDEDNPYSKKINTIEARHSKEFDSLDCPVYKLLYNFKVYDHSEENIKLNEFKKDFKDAIYNLAKELKK